MSGNSEMLTQRLTLEDRPQLASVAVPKVAHRSAVKIAVVITALLIVGILLALRA